MHLHLITLVTRLRAASRQQIVPRPLALVCLHCADVKLLSRSVQVACQHFIDTSGWLVSACLHWGGRWIVERKVLSWQPDWEGGWQGQGGAGAIARIRTWGGGRPCDSSYNTASPAPFGGWPWVGGAHRPRPPRLCMPCSIRRDQTLRSCSYVNTCPISSRRHSLSTTKPYSCLHCTCTRQIRQTDSTPSHRHLSLLHPSI